MAVNAAFELYQQLERDFAALIRPTPFSAGHNLRLERISHLLALLGNPHRAYPTIHVGGTSGKGSTSAMIAAILTEAGYKTGLHMSPHLQIMNERYQINTMVARTSDLAALFAEMKPALARVAAENPYGLPSYFEAQVALSFLLFQRQAVEVAVVEVGLGGTLDATNVVEAAVAVLTNVSLDHTAILGDTIEEIARDKAGIIKPGQTVISGFRQPTVRKIVAQRCQDKNATLREIDRSFQYSEFTANKFDVTLPTGQTFANLELGLKGDFQLANAACAVAAVQALPGFDIPAEAVQRGLLNARIPGRVEVLQTGPVVVLDGAHNPEKMAAARQAIDAYYGDKRRITVLALKSDKAAKDVLPFVLGHTDRLIVTQFELENSLWQPLDAHILAGLAAEMAPGLDIQVIPRPMPAFEQARAAAGPDDLIWVTGSFFLVGNVREFWYPTPELVAKTETGLSAAIAL